MALPTNKASVKDMEGEEVTMVTDLDQKVIQWVYSRKTQWEEGHAFVTDKIAFRMRNLIKTLRKNYYGIFDKPTTNTGSKKTWVPLTESVVDAVVKNTDLDTKDINLRAKTVSAIGGATFARHAVRNRLDQMFFGEKLDRMIRQLSIDGTVVWKTWKAKENGKTTMKVKQVDLLNFYIDPTAENIQETSGVIERAVLSVAQVKAMDGWKNTEDVSGVTGLNRNDLDLVSTNTEEKAVEVFEYWGEMPKSFITGSKDDENTMVEGQIVVSGIRGGTSGKVHLVRQNKNVDETGLILKPYEESWYKRVPGRWHGRGPAEMVMMLQLWINTIVNIRITRARVSQLGIFKVKQGSGITPQMLSKIAVNGAITVKQPDDIVQMAMSEASSASYTDEQNAVQWAEKVTSAFEVVTGEQLPSSTPATNAVLQNRSAQSQFVMVKEQMGIFLQRWLKRHAMPIIAETMEKNEVERITADSEELKEVDEKLANKLIFDKLQEELKNGRVVRPESVERQKQEILEKLKAKGRNRFVKLMKKVSFTDYDVQVFITNEEIDKSVLVNNLLTVLQTVPNIPDMDINPADVVRLIIDTMGLDADQLKRKKLNQVPGAPGMPQLPPGQGGQVPQSAPQGNPTDNPTTPTEQQIVTEANTQASQGA